MYRGVAAYIEGFCRANDIKELYTDDLTEAFGEESIYYLQAKGMMLTTVKGIIERTKVDRSYE